MLQDLAQRELEKRLNDQSKTDALKLSDLEAELQQRQDRQRAEYEGETAELKRELREVRLSEAALKNDLKEKEEMFLRTEALIREEFEGKVQGSSVTQIWRVRGVSNRLMRLSLKLDSDRILILLQLRRCTSGPFAPVACFCWCV